MADTAFDYQQAGTEFLARRRLALLADEMGLGKSLQAIQACDRIGAQRVCVLCPASARVNWIREFERWSTQTRVFVPVYTSHQVVGPNQSAVCSYSIIGRGNHVELLDDRWDVLILDECHGLKAAGTKRTWAVLGPDGVIHRAGRTWFLSGTPAPNHVGELWTMLFTMGVTALNYDAFIDRYCTGFDDGYRWRITGTNTARIPEVRDMLSTIMLRRRKKDVMKQLPPIHYGEVTVEPGEVDTALCFPEFFIPHSREDELFARIQQERTALESTLSVRKQSPAPDQTLARVLESMSDSVVTMRRFDGLRKVAPVATMLREELDNDYYKVVVFAIHKWTIENLRRALSGYGAMSLYGGTSVAKRQRNIDKFQDPDSKARVFIGNIQAAGTAITLTAAHHVVFVEQSWVPGENAQAAMRCHRIGQTQPVTVRFVSLNESTDQQVVRVLRKKTKELTQVFDAPG